MLNINDLESRYTKYKIKSYLPTVTVAIVAIGFGVYSIFMQKPIEIEKPKTTQKIVKKEIKPVHLVENNTSKIEKKEAPKKEQKPLIVEKETLPPKQKEKKLVLSPSLDFMKRINSSVPDYTAKQKAKPVKKIKKEVIKKVSPKKQESEVQEVKTEVVTTEVVQEAQEPKLSITKKSTMTIRRNKDGDDLKDVIRRFKVNNSPALSLFIAKKYYQMGDYQKSYNYALITNQINSNIESSWIIFAKSLAKLGKKEMAISMLKQYIDNSHSSRAKILLEELKSGKFK
jgi:tetratricopeptide (TPR) repeat protein